MNKHTTLGAYREMLDALAEGPASRFALENRLRISSDSVSRKAKRLIKHGWVTQQVGQGQNGQYIIELVLTPTGHDMRPFLAKIDDLVDGDL